MKPVVVKHRSPSLSAQYVKEFFKLVKDVLESWRILSAQCSIWKRDLPQFSSLHANSFALTSL